VAHRDNGTAFQHSDAGPLASSEMSGAVRPMIDPHPDGPGPRLAASCCGGHGPARRENADIHPRIAERILRKRIEADPLNMELKGDWVVLQCNQVLGDVSAGKRAGLEARLIRACQAINGMLMFDAADETWMQLRDELDTALAKFACIERTAS
jgi:hypothetical protein